MGRVASTQYALEMGPPNKRLKVTGGDRSKGSGVLCAGVHELSFNDTALGERVARSLSAIREAAPLEVRGGLVTEDPCILAHPAYAPHRRLCLEGARGGLPCSGAHAS